MMSYGGWGNMMSGWSGGGLMVVFGWVVLIDLILLGVWLWKQIQKK